MSEDAILHRLGFEKNENPEVLRLVNHDSRDASALKDLGSLVYEDGEMPLLINRNVIEADAVFSIGTIEPHIMAGFGGGYKNILPGCAGLETVSATHLLGPAASRFGNVGRFPEDCAVRRRIDDAARKAVPNCFIINTVLDSANNVAGVFCGEAGQAHRVGCEMARKVWGAPLAGRADVLLASGYPMTHDLCQASKAFSTGIEAVKEGGMVLLALRCRDGLGDYCVSSTDMAYEEVRAIVRSRGTESYVEVKRKETRGSSPMSFYEAFLTQSNAEALRKADVYVYAPDIPFEVISRFGLFKAFRSMESMIEEARTRFPKAEVVLSPSGGTCFPYF
jgi:nickel-dependent lactate racemase